MKRTLIFGVMMTPVLGMMVSPAFLVSCGGAAEDSTDTDTNKVVEVVVPEPVSYTVDTTATVINWYNMDAGAVGHQGTVKVLDGSFTTLEDSITAGSLTINMASATESTSNTKFLGHPATADLLDFVGFPQSTFTVERHETDTVYGTLSAVGKDFAVKAPVTVDGGNITIGDFKIDMSGLTFFVTEKTKQKDQAKWHDANIGFTATLVGVAAAAETDGASL